MTWSGTIGPLPRGRPRMLTPLGAIVVALALSGSPADGSAQTSDITGIVRDSLNNETLPSALVILVDEAFRTLTDEFGRFTLVNVADGSHTLRVEYLGYRTKDVVIDGGPVPTSSRSTSCPLPSSSRV